MRVTIHRNAMGAVQSNLHQEIHLVTSMDDQFFKTSFNTRVCI